MKSPLLLPVTVIALLMVPACDRKSSEAAKQLEELKQKANDAVERQKELERQLEDQKLATEREAIERDRMQIETDREALARQQGDAAADKAAEITNREQALAKREGRLEQVQVGIDEKQSDLSERGAKLNEQERDLAGREALPFQSNEQQEPVGDYGMFYDQLSSYGSWYETPDYGYVWQPVVVSDSNWRPYCRGRWICSDRGWTWVSDEPFGWATYHYGRWALVRGRGWVWVPGSEWAPCWVSWRENGSHIGWAPLPPETLAYRNHRWDSSVDTQFGIGALWFNFVEIRHFGSPLYQHCLPISGNNNYFQQTTNITYIHIENRQVICGGPRYKEVCDRIGRPIPFCRLEMDQHPRPGGNAIGMRPQMKGDRLLVSAPNMNAGWNEGMKPKRIKGRMETMEVERNEPLRPEIADRFKKNREENLRIADRSIQEMGGNEQFNQRRTERLEQNRRQGELQTGNPEEARGAAKPADQNQLPKRSASVAGDGPRIMQTPKTLENPAQAREIHEGDVGAPLESKRESPAVEMPREATRVRPSEPKEQARRPVLPPQGVVQEESLPLGVEKERQRNAERVRKEPKQSAVLRNETAIQNEPESLKPQEPMHEQAAEAREAQKEAMAQQREQTRQREQTKQDVLQQQRQEQQNQQAAQAREAQKEAMAQQREQIRQREQAAQIAYEQQEQARREQQNQQAQQAAQAREAQKEAIAQQREQVRQDALEQQRQEQQKLQAEQAREAQKEAMEQQQESFRQQQESQRQQQQENFRQQQESQRQQQQEQARQQEQKKEQDKNQEQERKRNR